MLPQKLCSLLDLLESGSLPFDIQILSSRELILQRFGVETATLLLNSKFVGYIPSQYSAYRKRPKSNSITGISPDVFGSGFIEKRTNFYINGMLELQSSYLELYTGVTMIEKDKKALISGSLAGDKFKVSVKNEFLSL